MHANNLACDTKYCCAYKVISYGYIQVLYYRINKTTSSSCSVKVRIIHYLKVPSWTADI